MFQAQLLPSGKIVHKPNMRRDINLDPDLRFKPNVDGDLSYLLAVNNLLENIVELRKYWHNYGTYMA